MMAKKMKRNRRIQQTTLIIVGEGSHEKAFLSHMKVLYDLRNSGQKVKVIKGDGGSPFDVINNTIKKSSHAAYDFKFILMDNDVLIRQQEYDLAKKQGIEILLSEPLCLEGMLLEVIGQSPSNTAEACKKLLHPQLSGKPTEEYSYKALFTKEVLDETDKLTIVRLRNILSDVKN